jgi:dTDP-3-amino-3,4,6-trideoxy-alpha-D-glucose transaminase
MPVLFGNLRAHYEAFRGEIDAAIRRTLDSGWYVLGRELAAFEQEFAAYIGVRHCVGVGNGTDAIEIALRALEIGAGDEVITVSHTATFTAIGIAGAGAEPVFVDIDEHSYTMAPKAAARALTPKTKAVVPVHLYGAAADLDGIARELGHGIPIIEDVAQAHGATLRGRRLGSIGTLGCFSFYPSKNLGCFGDGGAVTTNDDTLAERLRQIRNGGQADRYQHVVLGVNSRLDELQAAILRAQLPHLDAMNQRRREIAARYNAGLSGLSGLSLPRDPPPELSFVYHLYVVRSAGRDALREALARQGIATQVHYPIPAHRQKAFARSSDNTNLPLTDRVCGEVLSLPMYPELSDAEVDEVIAAVCAAHRDARRDAAG